MTEEECIKIAERVELWQSRLDLLGFGHWRIESVTVHDDEDHKASVEPSLRYDTARFYFDSTFVAESSEQELDEVIIHEWLHVFMRDLDTAIEAVDGELSSSTRWQWRSRVEHEREGHIDRLARQLYAFYNND